MNAHTYETAADTFRRTNGKAAPLTDAYSSQTVHKQHMEVETSWVAARRPYYTVYPLAAEALRKVKLDIPCSVVTMPIPTLLVRFGVGMEPSCAGQQLRCMLVGELEMLNTKRGLGVWCDFGERTYLPTVTHPLPRYTYMTFGLADDRTVHTAIQRLSYEGLSDADTAAVMAALHYIVAICLLSNDPALIEPDVLDKDRAKWAETQDPAIVERAVRRGKVGWLVGAHWETMPHYRRPHVGLRWTGEGRQVPKIVPIKGAVVHRQKLTEVPQGYLDDEKSPAEFPQQG